MRERTKSVFLAGLFGFAWLAGCGSDGGGAVDAGTDTDTGTDAGNTGGACDPAVSGQAASVSIHIRNESGISLFEPGECERLWRITSAAGDHAPSGVFENVCTEVNHEGCPADCLDETLGNELTSGEERLILWDGTLLAGVDAIAEGCPWAESTGQFCLPFTCVHAVDATAGTYTLDVLLKVDDTQNRSETITFEYPAQPLVSVTFGP
jgi:hypothetical protein